MGFTAAQIIGAIIGEEVPDVAAIGSADDVPERGFEIGMTLGEVRDITRGRGGLVPRIELPYSIMALCEVWTEDSNQRLMSMLVNTGRPYALYTGPGKTSKSLGGSGLVQIIGGFEVLSTEEVGYGSRGDQFGDADYWAHKGVLLTRINVGYGVIDLFSTHTYWGGSGILKSRTPSDSQRANTRREELVELKDFFNQHHLPDSPHIAIVVGDFNINAHGDEYPFFNDLMSQLGMRDQWAYQSAVISGQTPPAGYYGYTDSADATIAPLDDTGAFCVDSAGEQAVDGKKRFDYIWVELPRANHGFHLDVTRVRRRPFLRPNPPGGSMSDHLGLDCTLIFSPH
jgi:hypothetical protein